MNKSDEDIDLRLALGSRNYSVKTRLKSSSGAGVNANSRVEMPFAASDPLSELVWSPHNGLSLKCANSSLADNKPFSSWNVGESTDENLTSQSIRLGSGNNKVSAGLKLSVTRTMTDEAGSSGDKAKECGSKDLTDRAMTDDAVQEETRGGNVKEDFCSSGNVHTAGFAESSKTNAELDNARDKKLDTAVNWKFPSNLVIGRGFKHQGRLETHATRSSVMGLAVPLRSEPPMARVSEALVFSHPNIQAREQLDDEVTSASADVKKTKTDAALSSPDGSLMKQESSAENELGCPVAKEARSLGEMELPRDDSLPVDVAPMNSRICLYREKGKEKALSDGDIYGRSSNDKDGSHESVESCNSGGLLKGIKRQLYDQGRIVESKRMKNCLEGSPGSTSVLKADSSFMGWISNMVKGLADSNKDESSPLALAIPHSNTVCSYNHQESLISNKTTDFAKPTMGFQNVFQSLYCQTNKTPISGVQKDSQLIAESGKHMVANMKSLDNTPQPSNRNDDNLCKQIILSDQEVKQHISRSPIKPWIFSADFATGSFSEKSLAENKAVDVPKCSREITEGNTSDLLCKKVEITAGKMHPDIPLPTSCVPEKTKPLSSLWITRLYTRNAQFENCNRISEEEALDCNSDRGGANHESGANDVISIGQKTSEARDDSEGVMQSSSPKESVDLKVSHKQSVVQPFQELRSSEAMASVFAKRLDALRHIIHPSGRRIPPTFPLTCFFCGNSGHDLRNCPKLTETELENLLLNISSFNRVDESPCMCIRCFQLDHWAISCPLASSRGHRQSKAGAVEQQATDNKCSSYAGGKEDDHKNVSAGQVDCGRKRLLSSFPSFLNWNMKESSSKRLCTSNNELHKGSLSNLGFYLKEKQILPPCKLYDAQIAVPKEEIFHAIRTLRLSRADILRWMDSDVSLSHLNGFFLRLRLGKLERGLGGGTGYYVACITGDSTENIGCSSKRSVLVDVGGMKSSVGSQYISNHGFLEEEIEGWWSRIVKGGGKIPCLDELKSRFETRECLGL